MNGYLNDFRTTEPRVLTMRYTIHGEIRTVVPAGAPITNAVAEAARLIEGVSNVDPHSITFRVDYPEAATNACTPR